MGVDRGDEREAGRAGGRFRVQAQQGCSQPAVLPHRRRCPRAPKGLAGAGVDPQGDIVPLHLFSLNEVALDGSSGSGRVLRRRQLSGGIHTDQGAHACMCRGRTQREEAPRLSSAWGEGEERGGGGAALVAPAAAISRSAAPSPALMWSATRHCTRDRPGLAITTSTLCMAPGIILRSGRAKGGGLVGCWQVGNPGQARSSSSERRAAGGGQVDNQLQGHRRAPHGRGALVVHLHRLAHKVGGVQVDCAAAGEGEGRRRGGESGGGHIPKGTRKQCKGSCRAHAAPPTGSHPNSSHRSAPSVPRAITWNRTRWPWVRASTGMLQYR